MAYQVPKFLKRQGDSLLYDVSDSTFIFYIPEKFFTTKDAIIVGEYVNLLGIIDYAMVDKNGKMQGGVKQFQFPTVFLTKPGSMEKVKGFKISKYSEPMDYRLLKYQKGDTIVVSVKVEENIENVESFYGLLLRGNLPPTIPYDELWKPYQKNMKLNGEKYNITMQLFGVLYSEIYRDRTDDSKPFRLAKTDDMLAYKAMPVTRIPKRVSPYASLTSENWDESVVGAIMTPNNKYSPLEKILMD